MWNLTPRVDYIVWHCPASRLPLRQRLTRKWPPLNWVCASMIFVFFPTSIFFFFKCIREDNGFLFTAFASKYWRKRWHQFYKPKVNCKRQIKSIWRGSTKLLTATSFQNPQLHLEIRILETTLSHVKIKFNCNWVLNKTRPAIPD